MSNERYLMMESDIKSLSFQLESITKSKYDSDWHSTLHTHPFTELFYVVDGKGEFNIQGQRFPVKPKRLCHYQSASRTYRIILSR